MLLACTAIMMINITKRNGSMSDVPIIFLRSDIFHPCLIFMNVYGSPLRKYYYRTCDHYFVRSAKKTKNNTKEKQRRLTRATKPLKTHRMKLLDQIFKIFIKCKRASPCGQEFNLCKE